MRDPDRWRLKTVLRVIGLFLMASLVVVFPMVGAGSGQSHEPGSHSIRQLFTESDVGRIALALSAIGLGLIVIAAFLPGDDD
jgi:hypothetical protein